MQFSLTSLTVAASVLILEAAAQTYPAYNPNDTALAVRDQWCVQQEASCDLLCLNQQSGGQYNNGCDPVTLTYSCVCADGTIPNATQYSQTIPYFICQEEVIGCQNLCNGDSTCITSCNTNRHCGASDPVRVNTSTITTQTANPTATSNSEDIIYTGFGTGAAAATATAAKTTTGSKSGQTSSSSSGLGLTSGAMALGQVYGATVFLLTLVCSTFVFLL